MLATLGVEAAAVGCVYWRSGKFLLEFNGDVRVDRVSPEIVGRRRKGEGRRRDSRDSIDISVDLRFKEAGLSWDATSTN